MKQNKPHPPTHLHVPEPFTPLLSLCRVQLHCSAPQASRVSLIHTQYPANIYQASASELKITIQPNKNLTHRYFSQVWKQRTQISIFPQVSAVTVNYTDLTTKHNLLHVL